jgi:hypothetical protein
VKLIFLLIVITFLQRLLGYFKLGEARGVNVLNLLLGFDDRLLAPRRPPARHFLSPLADRFLALHHRRRHSGRVADLHRGFRSSPGLRPDLAARLVQALHHAIHLPFPPQPVPRVEAGHSLPLLPDLRNRRPGRPAGHARGRALLQLAGVEVGRASSARPTTTRRSWRRRRRSSFSGSFSSPATGP